MNGETDEMNLMRRKSVRMIKEGRERKRRESQLCLKLIILLTSSAPAVPFDEGNE